MRSETLFKSPGSAIQVISVYGPYLSILAIGIVEFRQFLFGGSTMVADFVPPSSYYVLQGELSTFNPIFSGGTFNSGISVGPLSAILAVSSTMVGTGLTYSLDFLMIEFVSGASMILLLRHLFELRRLHPLSETVGGIMFAVNPWTISEGLLAGHYISIGWACAVTPLFILFASKLNKQPLMSSSFFALSLIVAFIGICFYTWTFMIGLLLFLTPVIALSGDDSRQVLRSYFSNFYKSSVAFCLGLCVD